MANITCLCAVCLPLPLLASPPAAAGWYTAEARTTTPSVSGPSWSSMLTGVWPGKHGVTDNGFAGRDYARHPSFLARVEQLRPDETSHQFGSIGAEYRDAVALADRQVGMLVKAIRARPGYSDEDWLPDQHRPWPALRRRPRRGFARGDDDIHTGERPGNGGVATARARVTITAPICERPATALCRQGTRTLLGP